MSEHRISREQLTAAARVIAGPGISTAQAFVIAFADLSGQPLDPERFDDAATILRAERLVDDGLGLGEAIRTAHAERVTWAVPQGRA